MVLLPYIKLYFLKQFLPRIVYALHRQISLAGASTLIFNYNNGHPIPFKLLE